VPLIARACDAKQKRGERDDLYFLRDFHLKLTFLVRVAAEAENGKLHTRSCDAFCKASLILYLVRPYMKQRALWRCKKCGRDFANRNQSHACGRHNLEDHFSGKPPEIRALFDKVVAVIRELGPVRILPEKTRIAFQVRMSFAQVTPKLRWLDGHVVLARRFEHPRFRQIQTISPRNHVHSFRITSPHDIDAEFTSWLTEAYSVGEQRHIERKT
jgi:hypothetical protein